MMEFTDIDYSLKKALLLLIDKALNTALCFGICLYRKVMVATKFI